MSPNYVMHFITSDNGPDLAAAMNADMAAMLSATPAYIVHSWQATPQTAFVLYELEG